VVVTQLDDTFRQGNEFGIGFLATLPGVEDSENPESANIEERINIVILGLDLRRNEPDDQAARTDSVMILTIDPFAKTSGVFSIPRDTWVEIPDGFGGFIMNRINVAFELGEHTYLDYDGGGAGLVKDTIEHNFGIPIDNYIVLNFNNFIELIDELGGIDVDVPSYAYDAAYNDCNFCPYYPVEFFAGLQHMDGETALAYARIRKSDNDFRRIERQQLVVRATAKKASSLGTILSNPIGIYGQFKDSIDTDISEFLIPNLAQLAQQVNLDTAPMVSMEPATYNCVNICGGAAALQWDPVKAKELQNQVFTDGRLQKEGALVSVKNGTVTPDLAGEFATFLSQQGMQSSRIAVDEYFGGALTDATTIYDLSGKDYTARKLADWLHLPYARILTADDVGLEQFVDELVTTDVIVVLGADVDFSNAATNSAGLSQIATAGG
jgi:LCP family protein required for cell wall assembly